MEKTLMKRDENQEDCGSHPVNDSKGEKTIGGELIPDWINQNFGERNWLRRLLERVSLRSTSAGKVKLAGRWKDVAQEVYARKTLLLASKRHLEQNKVENPVALASTDVFVEKAQKFLSSRAWWYFILGSFTGLAAIAVPVSSAVYLFTVKIKDILELQAGEKEIGGAMLAALILKASSATAFLGAATYFLVSISRAFLHEATVLYGRRHALRFGRLYVYIKNGKVSFKELEQAFNWSKEFPTAFRDINPDKVVRLPISKLIDALAETPQSMNTIFKKKAKRTRTRNGQKSAKGARGIQ